MYNQSFFKFLSAAKKGIYSTSYTCGESFDKLFVGRMHEADEAGLPEFDGFFMF